MVPTRRMAEPVMVMLNNNNVNLLKNLKKEQREYIQSVVHHTKELLTEEFISKLEYDRIIMRIAMYYLRMEIENGRNQERD